MLSIIIPTLNESKSGYLQKILAKYQSLKNIEIICVDGGSTDDTVNVINASNALLIKTSIPSRAGRLNRGIIEASNDLLILHHPRSILTLDSFSYLIENQHMLTWGAFTHQFDLVHPLLKFTSWYSNKIRGEKKGIFYLDHCLFAKKDWLIRAGLFPEIDIFEDTEICLRLKNFGLPKRLPFISTTSAIRFEKNGVLKQALRNQYLKWAYYFKMSHENMNKQYEKGVTLNTEYKDKDD